MKIKIEKTVETKTAFTKFRKILKAAKNATKGTIDGINFKKVGQTIILF